MSDTLRDQLLGLGFKAPTPERKPARKPGTGGNPTSAKADPARHGQRRPDGKPSSGKPPARGDARTRGRGKPASREDIDLAKAYAIRAQKEKDERIAAEKQKQEEARLRREARARLATLLDGKALNREDAEIARHFEYGGKIKRIYVTADQLQALNAGELGVAQLNGRYLLVTAAVLAEAEAVFAPSVALRVDPDAPAGDDPYADPKYQVPDDLVW
ncbi:DUF2058 domain-containing protein [Luteimonas sp. MHLX1A]|uniref:DUF2058 domain-containing protein n=1 Tax=Alterluteimonas muca TaxID=2878684 RepID=UPI001E335350|nr:DUF2058 family protein [Luteimonas sp. MHLX1A]MCD9046660.1 DUF2058 family protein [Luteimonas sp. MHLX1A]